MVMENNLRFSSEKSTIRQRLLAYFINVRFRNFFSKPTRTLSELFAFVQLLQLPLSRPRVLQFDWHAEKAAHDGTASSRSSR